jgi:ribonuclease HI
MRFPVHQKSGRVTNNIAEALAVFLLISTLHNLKYFAKGRVEVFCDSQLIVNQLKGFYATKDASLLKIHRQTYHIFEQIKKDLKVNKDLEVNLSDALTLTHISGVDMKLVLGH